MTLSVTYSCRAARPAPRPARPREAPTPLSSHHPPGARAHQTCTGAARAPARPARRAPVASARPRDAGHRALRPLTCLGRDARGKRRGWPRGRRSRACARRAAGRLNPLLAALRPRPRPRPWGARTRLPGRPPPSARAYLPRRGRARGSIRRRGARTLRGPGGRRGGTGRREPGWISRFHPDSPSALPADSVLFGDHVTRAAFDPGLGAGRGRGPRPEGCQARDPRGRCAAARVPEAMTPSKQSPGEANKLFGVREGPALGVGEAAEGRRGDKDSLSLRLTARNLWLGPRAAGSVRLAGDNPPGPPQTAG